MPNASNPRQLVVFTLGTGHYALGIQQVQEIIRYSEPRSVASRADWVRGEMDIGARNVAAVRAGLARSGVTIRAAETGGDRGRTLRVTVGEFVVIVKEAGGQTVSVFDGSGSMRLAAGTRA